MKVKYQQDKVLCTALISMTCLFINKINDYSSNNQYPILYHGIKYIITKIFFIMTFYWSKRFIYNSNKTQWKLFSKNKIQHRFKDCDCWSKDNYIKLDFGILHSPFYKVCLIIGEKRDSYNRYLIWFEKQVLLPPSSIGDVLAWWK